MLLFTRQVWGTYAEQGTLLALGSRQEERPAFMELPVSQGVSKTKMFQA